MVVFDVRVTNRIEYRRDLHEKESRVEQHFVAEENQVEYSFKKQIYLTGLEMIFNKLLLFDVIV